MCPARVRSVRVPRGDEVSWGLLVDVWAREARTGAPTLVLRDLPVGPALAPGATLTASSVTGVARLQLDAEVGSADLRADLEVLTAGLVPVFDGDEVPRDAALVVRAQPDAAVLLGDLEPRVLVHPLEPSLLVVDALVSDVDAVRAGGLAARDRRGLAVGQLHSFTVQGRGRTLARSLRGAPSHTPLAGGFSGAPQVLGAFRVDLSQITPLPGAPLYHVDVTWTALDCAQTPRQGDQLRTGDGQHVFEVFADGPVQAGGSVLDVLCVLQAGDPATVPGRARGWHGSTWDPTAGDDPDCYARTFPAPGTEPADDVAPDSLVAVRFTEPIQAATAQAYDHLGVSRVKTNPAPTQWVAGDASQGEDGSLLYFSPHQALPHTQGFTEQLFVQLDATLKDLDGLSPASLPTPAFRLDPAAPTTSTHSLVLHFDTADEDGNGFPELRGQYLLDIAEQAVHGRPVSRFSRAADASQTIPSLMHPFAPGVQNPLNPLGARSMHVYRYADLGFSASDETYYDLDVERLHWAPVGGQVIFDHYGEYELSLSHSSRLPDEIINPASLLPALPNSGLLSSTFDENILETDGSQVVHPRALGYTLNPLDLFSGVSGTALMPYPLNTGPDPSTYAYFTWRATDEEGLGGSNGGGVPLDQEVAVGLEASSGSVAAASFVPSFGLPLLMDFKCFPDDGSLGLNALNLSIAVNSSSKPNFRVFSGGGFNTSGLPVIKDPDLEQVPSGGFNPTSFPPGQLTPPRDNSFFTGQVDFVVRVSRAHSVWFDSQVANPDWSQAVLEADLPAGTSLLVEWRGATDVGGFGASSPKQNALALDAYGDQPGLQGIPGDPSQQNLDVVFLGGDSGWKSSLDEVDGARYVQARLTFTADPVSGLVPRLDALSLSFTN